MAAEQTVQIVDPALLTFIDRLIEKGLFPVVVLFALWYLVAKYGWPWQGRDAPPVQPAPPQSDRAVVDAVEDLTEKFDTFRLQVVQRLTAVETEMKLRRRKGDE